MKDTPPRLRADAPAFVPALRATVATSTVSSDGTPPTSGSSTGTSFQFGNRQRRRRRSVSRRQNHQRAAANDATSERRKAKPKCSTASKPELGRRDNKKSGGQQREIAIVGATQEDPILGRKGQNPNAAEKTTFSRDQAFPALIPLQRALATDVNTPWGNARTRLFSESLFNVNEGAVELDTTTTGSYVASLVTLSKRRSRSTNRQIMTNSDAKQSLPIMETKRDRLLSTPGKKYDISRLRDRWWKLIASRPPQDHSASSDLAILIVPKYHAVETNHRDINAHDNLVQVLDDHYLDSAYPIVEAVRRDDVDALRLLMKTDDARYLETDNHQSPLQLAVCLDKPHLVRALVYGAKKGSTFIKDTPNFPPALLSAAENGYDECLQILVSNGSTWLSAKDSFGNNVLHAACQRFAPSSILELVLHASGGSLSKLLSATNSRKQNPVHVACCNDRVDAIDTLLSWTGSFALLSKVMSMQDIDQQTPMLAAVASGSIDVVMSILMWRGNNQCCLAKCYSAAGSMTAPCALTWAVKAHNVVMVELLLEFSDTSGAGYDLTSALHEVVRDRALDNSVTLEIVRVLVDAGANPCTSAMREFEPSAVELAAEQFDVDAIVALLDAYAVYLKRLRFIRRRDPSLSKQPESFFAGMESRENAERVVALRNALISSLYYSVRQSPQTTSLYHACTFALYRRGARLGQVGVNRLRASLADKSMHPLHQVASPLGTFYEAKYRHVVVSLPDSKDPKMAMRYWSQVMMHQAFSLSSEHMGCSWTASADASVDTISRVPSVDFIIVAEDGIRLGTHSSILLQKSEKLGAAFRFASMSQKWDKDHGTLLQMEVSIPSEMCVWLLHHIYHGSLPSIVWSGPIDCARENLLELLLIGDEFLCPSLVQECEIRLVSAEKRCFCWSCCERTGCVENEQFDCFYRTEMLPFSEAQGYVTPKCAVDILAIAQRVGGTSAESEMNGCRFQAVSVSDQCAYNNLAAVCQGSASDTGSKLCPMEALRCVARRTILQDFESVARSDSFRSQLDSCDAAEWTRAQECLLEMCLEELPSFSSVGRRLLAVGAMRTAAMTKRF
jgi:ankyrin repeat protein